MKVGEMRLLKDNPVSSYIPFWLLLHCCLNVHDGNSRTQSSSYTPVEELILAWFWLLLRCPRQLEKRCSTSCSRSSTGGWFHSQCWSTTWWDSHSLVVWTSALAGIVSSQSNLQDDGHPPKALRIDDQKRRKKMIEKLWQEFFSDPSQWWDHRAEKINPRYPDFKHKRTEESLWLDGKLNPPWIEAQLAAMIPGTLEASLFTWSRRLARYVKSGQHEKTLELFRHMQQEGMDPDKFTFVPVLNACSSLRALEEGRHIHAKIIEGSFESDIYVGNALIDMYAKCGSIEDACKVFNKMPRRDAVSWNAMILGYVKCGEGEKALELFEQMQHEEVEPDPVTFVGVVNACASVESLEEGRLVHEQIISKGFGSDIFVCNTLIDMYSKCGSTEDAWRVFKTMSTRNEVAWSAMIMGYIKCGKGQRALELSRQMQRDSVVPNPVTFVVMLKACASIAAVEEGRLVHEQIIKRGFESDVFVRNSLVDMYAKCGSIEDARRVFNKMPTRDVVAWNAMIQGYVKCGDGQEAFELFQQMRQENVDPDPFTYVAILNACASLVAIEKGRQVHGQIIQRGYQCDVFVRSGLVDMYVKCGSIADACRVFNHMPTRNVVTWNAMILGYSKCGEGQKALDLFRQMQQEGVDPDPFTFVGSLTACANVLALEEGRHVHEQIILRGVESDLFVANALVDMYSKCGSMEDARRVFDSMVTKDVVAWSAIILGYVRNREGEEAFKLCLQMFKEGVEPDRVTYMGVLNACASVAALEEGRHVHQQIVERGYISDVSVGNCLVDMYAKCGSIEDARRVFDRMPTRDRFSWNAMLAGYGKHGYAKEALEHFSQMCEVVEMDGVTFMSLLSACSHGGLVDEGLYYFETMVAVYNISPTMEHYACVVDVLGRAGRLHEVEDLIGCMPFAPDVSVWMSLLASCRVHANLDIGERGAKQVLGLDPENDAGYALLSNLYAAASKWDNSANVRRDRWVGKQFEQGAPKANLELVEELSASSRIDSEVPQIAEVHAQLERYGRMNLGMGKILDPTEMKKIM